MVAQRHIQITDHLPLFATLSTIGKPPGTDSHHNNLSFLRGTFYKTELSGEIPKDQVEGKARLHIDNEDRAAIFDSLILCRFFRDFILWDELTALVEASTGMTMDRAGLLLVANRITQQNRRFNAREDLGPASDTLPERFFREQTAEGASINRSDLERMVAEYNAIRQARESDGGAG